MPDPERPPRLVLRFAVGLSLALGVASIVILLVVRHFALDHAEHAATRYAGVVASSLLQRELRPEDFKAVVEGERRRELDAVFSRQLVSADTLALTLVSLDGLVTYSTDHRLIGTTESKALAREAAGGAIVSRLAPRTPAGAKPGEKALETYAPTGAPGDDRGAAIIVQSYAAIESAANHVLIRVGAVLEGLLLILFLAFVPLLARVTRRIRAQIDQIQHHAWHDELTGLPNRRQFAARLEELDAETVAVLTFDLDRFKEINEILGHESGDRLLCELGRRIARVIASDSLLARLGGDEFGILLEGAGRADASATARLVLEELREPYEVKGVPVGIEASIGVALSPEHGADAESLLRRANVAMYVAKDHRLGFAFYEPHLDATDTARLSLLSELRRALAEHEIVPYYQLKGHMRGNTVAGAETLLRWQHPERGLVSAGEFVPFAERTGLNRELTQYALAAAAKQIQAWSARGVCIKVAVNLTAFDLFDPELPGQVAALIEESGIAASHLELEITESAAMRDIARVRTVLEELRRMGMTLAIDDFGTGYSSLAYLKTLPVHTLKLDKSLIDGVVENPKDRAIVQAAIDVAHGLGLEVVAEGIETAEVWDCLATLGCDVGQGYYFARPSPASEVTSRLLARGVRSDAEPAQLRAVASA